MGYFNWFLRLALLVALPAALLLSGNDAVDAQERLPPIVDVRDIWLDLTVAHTGNNELRVVVRNDSTIPIIRNVQVRITTDPPEELGKMTAVGGRWVGGGFKADPDQYDAATGIWTIPELGSREGLHLTSEIFYFEVVKVRAEIIVPTQAENATQLDHSRELWVHFSNSDIFNVRSDTYISAVAVDNRSPAPGENPVFRVQASDWRTVDLAISRVNFRDKDVVVKVALSEGLVFAPGQSASAGTTFSRSSPTTGVWRLGSGARVTGTLSVPVQLSTSDAPLNRRCLTVQIVASRPPPDHAVGGVHTACLGSKPPLVFSDNRISLRDFGCPTTDPDTIAVCREGETGRVLAAFHYNVPGDPTGGTWYRAEDLIFLVDPVAHQNPGTVGGTTWSWSTGQTLDIHGVGDFSLPGVRLERNAGDNRYVRSRKFTISNVPSHGNPGTIAELYRWWANSKVNYWEGLNPDKSDKLVDSIADSRNVEHWSRVFVFSEPGVYKVNAGIEWTRKSDNYTGSGTGIVTFVVGYLVDLQVYDAARTGTLPRGQQAYTLRATNNLGGTAKQVEVALTGVPQGARAVVSSGGGRYDPGACDESGLCAGVWKIGDLESREDRYNTGRSDGPTLTLLVQGNPDPITATIASKQTRTVMVGGKSHTIGVTELDDSNNDARVAVGTGRGEPDPEAPQSLRVDRDRLGSIALLRWQPVELVSRWLVSHYQVQRDNPALDIAVKEPQYLDLEGSTWSSVYRVRAVNQHGIPGPWSQPAAQGVAGPSGFTAMALGDTEIQLSWSRLHGGAVVHYEVQYSEDGGNSWSFLAQVAATDEATYTYTDSGLPVNTTRHYRVRGVARSGDVESPGTWSAVRSATTAHGIRAPELTASAAGQDAIDLSWTVMAGATGYQVQMSSDGGATWTALATVGAADRTYTHQGLQPGATFHYRVRATDSGGGENPWSNTATASTFVLGAPAGLRAESAQPTAIVLWWTAATGATGYEVQVSPDAGATWADSATLDDGAATTYTHRGLTTGVTRHYRVRATGAGNSLSAWSNVASARTQALNEVPGVRVVQKPGYYPAVLEWPTLEDPTITGYEFQWSKYEGRWTPLTDRYYGTGGGDEYIQPDHLTAYCVCLDSSLPPYEPWLRYDDWVGSGTTFRVRILREGGSEGASGQNQQPNEPGSVEAPPGPTVTGVAVVSEPGDDDTYVLDDVIRVRVDLQRGGGRERQSPSQDRHGPGGLGREVGGLREAAAGRTS